MNSYQTSKWEWVALEEAVEICDYLRKPVNSKERAQRIADKREDELYPYYGATGQVGYIDSYLLDGEYVLLGEDGAPFLDPFAKKAYLINGKGWVNNHAHVLKSRLNNKFLCYYLNQVDYNGLVTGTTRYKLTQATMKRMLVPTPDVAEQERIVFKIEELFSKPDASEAELKTAKEKLKVYRQAVLKEAFRNVSKKAFLKSLFCGTPQNGLYKSKVAYGEGIRILRIDGFYDGFINSEYEYKRLSLSREEIEKYSLNQFDLVINRVNSMPYLGKCALIRHIDEMTVFESNIMRVRLNLDVVSPEYVTYFLASDDGRRELTKNAKQAVNQASINQTDVGNTLIPIPEDRALQEHIVATIEQNLSVCDSIESNINISLQQAEALRQSILKQAFEGTLI